MSEIDLTVVIVSYQVRDLLERCLDSIQRIESTVKLELIVVDNASTDRTAEMVRERFPSIQLIANSENLGFSRANNVGLKRAGGRYWMLLNPDTEIEPGENPFRLMVDFMDGHPHAGACGASLFYPDGSRQHSAFHFSTLAQIYIDLFPVHWRIRESGLNGRYPFRQYDAGEPFQIDHPLGAALMVRPEAVAQIGLLDEDFFIYAEEVDWCMRLKRAGWEVWCVPQARIIHHEARSTGQFRDKMFVELWKARFTLFRKNYSRSFNALASLLVRQGLERAIRQARSNSGEVTQADSERKIAAYQRVIQMSREGSK